MADVSKIEVDGTTYDIADTVARSKGGLTDDVKQALLAMFQKVAYIDANGQTYYDTLEEALYPPANLVSISAAYSVGSAYTDQSLDSLRPNLVVTANFDDYSTRTVTAYTLSGTLTEGTSTITVAYGGKTTTFTVTVLGSRFSLSYMGNYTTSTPSNTRVTLITSEISLPYGKTLKLSAQTGYKIYPLYEYGAGTNQSTSRSVKTVNQIYIYAINSESGYIYTNSELVIGKPGDSNYRILADTSGWSSDGGTINYSIQNTNIAGVTLDGICFYIEKTDGSNITETEAKSAVSWIIE